MDLSEWYATASFVEKLHHKASLYDRGIVCPGEAWNQIADLIDAASEAELSAELPAETIDLLRRCKEDRPVTFWGTAKAYRRFDRYMEILD